MTQQPATSTSFTVLLSRIWEVLRLAAPTIVMRSGGLLMVMADIVMLGHASSQELAYYSLAQGPVMAMVLTGLGLLLGTLVLTSQYFGAGRYKACGGVWRRSIPYAFVIGFLILAACSLGPQMYIWMGQDASLAEGAANVTFAIGVGVPGYLGYLASAYFLEGLKRPWPGTFVMLGGNVLNLILNLLWIDAYGADGASWATTVTRWCMCLIAAGLVWFMADHGKFGVRYVGVRDRKGWAMQRRLGYGAGLSIGVEGFAFGSLNVMSGWAGTVSLASYAIGINLLGLMFMLALGVGGATSVLVGHAYGAKDRRGAAQAGWTGLGVNSLLEIPIMLMFALIPLSLAGIYTDDAAVLATSAILIGWMVFVLPFDGAQAVMSNALRGRGETFVPAVLQSCAFAFVMLPCGYWLSTGPIFGAEGLFVAILAGTLTSSVLLSLRFWWLAKKDREKAE